MKKIDWDTYYLAQCYLVSLRSIDQSTKCGAVIVSKDNRVLSQGYNGPLKNSDDTDFPTERPYKYYMTLHAEENAILAYNGSYQDIEGSTIYVTGKPCHKCLRVIIQKGIGRLVYPKIPLTVMQSTDSLEIVAFDDMVNRYKGDFVVHELDMDVINRISLLYDKCKLAVDERCGGYVFDTPKPPTFPPIEFFKEGKSTPEKCDHDWSDMFPSLHVFPPGRRCSKCLKQEW